MSFETRIWEKLDSMSGEVINESESGQIETVRRSYVMGRVESFNQAVALMNTYAPAYVNTDGSGKYWSRKRLSLTGIGNYYWDCLAEYQTLETKGSGPEGGGGEGEEPEDPATRIVPGSIAWDTTGRTERIYQALDETVYPNTQPSFDRAINVNANGVEGVDIVRPGMRYSETWIFPAALAMSDAYIRAVETLTGTLCLVKFRAFEVGECLFMGARCNWNGDQPFASITFDFDCRPNVAAFTVNSDAYGDAIAPFSKLGWEYVWIRYQDDVADDVLLRRPIAAYKNRVYEFDNWAGLKIVDAAGPGRPVQPAIPQQPDGGLFGAEFAGA
jgi:hypothetical protein